jgi:threonine dehydratase
MRVVEVGPVRCIVAFENPAGTAKWSGAVDWLSRLPVGTAVTAWSSGGHGCAVALAADRLGLRATVAVPRDAKPDRLELLARTGADVLLADDLEDAHRLALASPGVPVPGYDDVATIVAHGRLWRLVEGDGPVFVPVGGGGLVASAALTLPGRRVVGVEHRPATSLSTSLAAGRPTRVDPGDAPVAVRVAQVGRVPFAVLAATGVDTMPVTAAEVAGALERLHGVGVAAEPAGAIALAGALAFGGGTALVSGGQPKELG